jgi:hypothetical protein
VIESAAWLARSPDIAVARAELKPMCMARFQSHTDAGWRGFFAGRVSFTRTGTHFARKRS